MDALEVTPQDVKNIIKELGYEIVKDGDGLFTIQGSSGMRMLCAVEESILNVTLPLVTVTKDKITPDVMWDMLRSDNGLATSHVEIIDRGGGKHNVALMNYCKLQELGDDDRDDIETAIEFIELDALKARKLFSALGE